jgi:hypothetical protein
MMSAKILTIPQLSNKIQQKVCSVRNNCFLFVIPKADVVAGWGDGVPGDVEPAGAGKELDVIRVFFHDIVS